MKRKYSICLIVPIILLSCDDTHNQKEQQLFYYDNGKIKAINGMNTTGLNGLSVWFYPNGKLGSSITYINGEAEGHAYYFYESGALKARELYKNNKVVGYAEYFYDHSIGVLQAIRAFNDSGKMTYIKEFDTTGNVIREEGRY